MECEFTQKELEYLREEMERRRKLIETGEEDWVDGKEFFARMEKKYGSSE